MLVAQVGADGEAVRHTAVQVDLPGLAGFDQGLFGLVAELGGEDLVDFCFVCRESVVLLRGMILSGDYMKWGKGFYVPAAAMEKGPLIAPSSSCVTKEGWAE